MNQDTAPKFQSKRDSTSLSTQGFRWYVLHVFSGSEKRVVEEIKEAAHRKGVEDSFSDYLIPSRPVTEVRRGKKIKREKFFFPGYILIRMRMDDMTWNLVQNQSKVTDFLLNAGHPQPVGDDEAERMRSLIEAGEHEGENTIMFEVGEQVRVADGPFATFSGHVEDVDSNRQRLKVSVSIFGRATPVELAFNQVEKL